MQVFAIIIMVAFVPNWCTIYKVIHYIYDIKVVQITSVKMVKKGNSVFCIPSYTSKDFFYHCNVMILRFEIFNWFWIMIHRRKIDVVWYFIIHKAHNILETGVHCWHCICMVYTIWYLSLHLNVESIWKQHTEDVSVFMR